MLTVSRSKTETPIFAEEIIISVIGNERFQMNIEDITKILDFLLNQVKQQALRNGKQVKNSIVFQLEELAADGVQISKEQYGILTAFNKSRKSLVEDYESDSRLFTSCEIQAGKKCTLDLNNHINWLFLTEFYLNSTWYESPVPHKLRKNSAINKAIKEMEKQCPGAFIAAINKALS